MVIKLPLTRSMLNQKFFLMYSHLYVLSTNQVFGLHMPENLLLEFISQQALYIVSKFVRNW